MTAPLVIRPAARSDVDALIDLVLRSKASHGHDAAFMERCREELAIAEQTLSERDVWLAEAQGVIVGFFALEPPVDGVCEVNPIFVEPRLQQAGVGRALWRKLEERAHHAGAEAIGLDSDPHAAGFYEKMGCRIVGLSASGSIPGRMLPRMEKRLDSLAEPKVEDIHGAQARELIITTAKRMLTGECSYVEGSRIISTQLFAAGFDRPDHPFGAFVAIDSETDHIPVGSLREQWDSEALAKFEPEWRELETWARQIGEPACHDIIAVMEAALVAHRGY